MKNKKTQNLEFGDFIRKTRRKLNIGLREFASKVGISATYISKMEVGEYAAPKEENIKKMADILRVNADKLLAMADKISSDVKEKINTEPKLYAAFLRRVKPDDLEKFMKELEAKKDDGKRS
jgi:transcriptional regulator with XRE-family HTH domain